MIIKILKYIAGFVRFKAVGGFSDKFINNCERENIPLWDVKNRDGEITACTSVDGYAKMNKVFLKSGMKTRIIKKSGLRFFINKNRVRSGLCIGAVIFVLVLITLSQYAWRIEVVGNSEIPDEKILSEFEKYGVKAGAEISKIDLKAITENVLSSMPEISWATVNKKGSLLCIEVREKRKIPEMYDKSVPTNVIASEDGLILSSDVLQGTEEIKVGSAVRKGDLLISGIVTHRDGKEEFLHADGFVRAETKDNFNVSVDKIKVLNVSDYRKHTDIFFFGFSVPIGRDVYGDLISKNSSYLQSGDKILPVGVIKTTGLTFSDEILPSDETLKEICLFKCAEHIKKLTDTAEVKNSKITVTEQKEGFALNIYSICEKDIGILQEIYIEKNSDK